MLRERKALLLLALSVAAFHFAGATMLPLAGQKLALEHPGFETLLLSACILVAQLGMIPMALLVGARADRWGRKPLFVIACAALVARGFIFCQFDSALVLVGAQVLDGISGGILDILVPLMLADIMRGSGRYSVSRGLVGTVQGVGGSLSNVAGGTLVVVGGYNFAFAALALAAACALCLVIVRMPETGHLSMKGAA